MPYRASLASGYLRFSVQRAQAHSAGNMGLVQARADVVRERKCEAAGGAIQVSSGLDYDFKRIDLAYGSPLGDGWRFPVGGFFRKGEGPLRIGYDGFHGSQVKASITKQFANGYIRVYGKHRDDRQPNYALTPAAIAGASAAPTITDLPGNSIRSAAYDSQYTARFLGVD